MSRGDIIKIAQVSELHVLSTDTLRSPVTMWVLRLDDDLYVRAVKGRTGPWFRGTQTRHAGSIRSGEVAREVIFVEETDPQVNARIDSAYQEKYHRYPKEYVNACLTAEARTATLKLVPR
jgi:hypothetical protein